MGLSKVQEVIILLKMPQNLDPQLLISFLSSLLSSFPSFLLCVYYTHGYTHVCVRPRVCARMHMHLPTRECCRGHRSKSDIFVHHSSPYFWSLGLHWIFTTLFNSRENLGEWKLTQIYYFVQCIKSQISKHLSSTAILHIGKGLKPMFSHIPYTNGFDCSLAM